MGVWVSCCSCGYRVQIAVAPVINNVCFGYVGNADKLPNCITYNKQRSNNTIQYKHTRNIKPSASIDWGISKHQVDFICTTLIDGEGLELSFEHILVMCHSRLCEPISIIVSGISFNILCALLSGRVAKAPSGGIKVGSRKATWCKLTGALRLSLSRHLTKITMAIDVSTVQ